MSAPSLDPAAALVGTPYRFIARLGEGGMGTVVEAEHTGLAQRVVLKLLRPELAGRPDLVDRLRVEAQALARLSHPNLVRVTDFGVSAAGVAYLCMERLHGRSLAEELARRRPIPVAEAVAWMRQALAGLAAAHAAGLVHRDVKPENLFVCHDGTLKVLDFGVAKVVDEAALAGLVRPRFSTAEGGVIGTPLYAAPEQLEGGLVGPATDVYAAGLVLYELVAGAHPFARHRTADAIHHAQLVEMPPPPSRVSPQAVPVELDRAVMRAIAKRPSDRFASAQELALALDGGAPSDSRVAPTLVSAAQPAAPTLVSAVAGECLPTLASPVASESLPTLAAPTVRASPERPGAPAPTGGAPTVALGAPAPGVAPPQPVKSEALGAIFLVAGLLAGAWKLAGVFYALSELWDPVAHFETVHGRAPTVSEEFTLLSRACALVSLLEGLLLMAVGATFAVVGVILLRRARRGPPLAARAASAALVAMVLSALLNLVLVVPLRALLIRHLPDLADALPGVEAVGFAVSAAVLLGVSVVQVGFVAWVRARARRLVLSSST